MSNRIYTHPLFFQHEMGKSHPESPKRLHVLQDLFENTPEYQNILTEPPTDFDKNILLKAHTQSYLDILEESVPEEGLMPLDGDTSLTPHSLEAAKLAVSSAIDAVNSTIEDGAQHSFIAGRPPGHHAEPHKAMGFCLLNTVYITAQYAKTQGLERIAIVDFDVHHGNGTDVMMRQNTDDEFLFISTHEWPLYPGTGAAETSIENRILNIPLPSLSGSGEMREVYEAQVFPELDVYNPELLIISAGFDAHKDDPLASLQWVENDYHWLGQHFSKYKTISNLEGGYNLDTLPSCVDAYLKGLFQN